MIKHTTFKSFDEFLTNGGLIVNSKEDFGNIPNDVFDKHVQKETKFLTWESMIEEAATGEYVAKQLGF
jgi:hypothetical protein